MSVSGEGPAVPQLPLALRYPPDQRLDTYVTTEPGVVGLVASKIKERLHRPVIAFAPAEDSSVNGEHDCFVTACLSASQHVFD